MIKNIIFDFGDIFINLDKPATNKFLTKFGVDINDDELTAVQLTYEKGQISTEEFIRFFKQKYSIQKEDVLVAWNSILLDFPTYRLDFLTELAAVKKHRLFLLSNTNELHINWVKKSWGLPLFELFKNCFEKFYLSHEINLRKPDQSIFTFVLEENNLNPTETLFIDDVLVNTEAAEKLGIQVWNLIPGKEDVVDLRSKLKI